LNFAPPIAYDIIEPLFWLLLKFVVEANGIIVFEVLTISGNINSFLPDNPRGVTDPSKLELKLLNYF
jgi:hypothetical protein